MRRPRGPGGRFLTAEEIAAQKASQAQANNDMDLNEPLDDGGEGDMDGDGSAEPDDDHLLDIKKDLISDSRLLSLQIPPSEKIKQNPHSPISPFQQQTSPHPGMPNRGMYPQQQQQILHPYGLVHRSPATISSHSPSHSGAPGSAIENSVENEADNNSGGVTLRAPYGNTSSSFYPQDQATTPANSSSDVPVDSASVSSPENGSSNSMRSTTLHHVPHPHSHHSRAHPRHTHVHGQPHPTEAGGLYSPFNLAMPVDMQLFNLNMGMGGVNGQNVDGMNVAGNPDELNFDMMGLNGSIPPGEVRVGTSGVTPSVAADLQRRTDEILSFSVRRNLGS